MAPEDRVGQLFIVNFDGNEVTAESDITQLILSMRVGGVVISPRNMNFSNEKGVDTPHEVATLANQLQGVAYGGRRVAVIDGPVGEWLELIEDPALPP